MKIVELDKDLYKEISSKHPNISFYQTYEWGLLKQTTGWKQLLLGYMDDDKCVACGNFLLKRIPLINKYLAYCPRGYLIDYKDISLLKNFHHDLINYLKKYNCFNLIIDPNFPLIQRDINGDIVENGFDYNFIKDELINLGYKYSSSNKDHHNLQPKWLFRLPIDKPYIELENDFKNETKRRSRKKDFLAIETREMNYEDIPIFKQLMEMTAKRRNFIDRPLTYYQNMYNYLHDVGTLRYMIAEMNIEKCKENIQKEINIIEERIKKYKNPGRVKEETVTINSYKTIYEQINNLEKTYLKYAPLSVACIMTSGEEMIMLLAGNDEDYLQHFNSSNIMVTDLIKLAQSEGYKYFNFYGISGNFDPKDPQYGLYLYKRQYGGEVIELLGEYEFTINKLYKSFYDLILKIYRLFK